MKLVTLVTLAMSASLAASAPLEERAPAPAPSRPIAYGGGFGAGGGSGTADMNGSSNSTNGAGGVGAAGSGNNWSAAGAGALTKTGVKVTKRLGGDFGQAGIAANSEMQAQQPQQQQAQQAQRQQQQSASSNQRTPMASQSSQSQGHRQGHPHGQTQGAGMGAQQTSPMAAGAQQGGLGSAAGGQAGGQGAAMGGQGSAMGGQAGGRGSAMGGQAGGRGSAMGGQAGGQGGALGGQAGGQGSALGGQAAGQGSAAGGRGAAGMAARQQQQQQQQQPGSASGAGSQSSPFIGGNAAGDARGPSPGSGASHAGHDHGHHNEKNPGIIAPEGMGRRATEEQPVNVYSPGSAEDKSANPPPAAQNKSTNGTAGTGEDMDWGLNHPNSNGIHQGSGSSTSVAPAASAKGDYHSMDNFSSVVLPDVSKSSGADSKAMPTSTSSAPRETASMSKGDAEPTHHGSETHHAKPKPTATHHHHEAHGHASKRPQKTVFETTFTTVTTTMRYGQAPASASASASPKKPAQQGHGKESWQQEKNEDLRGAAHDVRVAQAQADDDDQGDEGSAAAPSKTMAAHAARDTPGESDKKNAAKIKADSLRNAERIKAEHSSDRAPARPIPHMNGRSEAGKAGEAGEAAAANRTMAMHHSMMANGTHPAHHKIGTPAAAPHAAMNATQPAKNGTESDKGASGKTQTASFSAQGGPQYGGSISNPWDSISSTFSPNGGTNTTINGHKYPGAAPKGSGSSRRGESGEGGANVDDADKATSTSMPSKESDSAHAHEHAHEHDADAAHKKAFEQGRETVKGAETEYPNFEGMSGGSGRRDVEALPHRPHLSAGTENGHPHAESDFASSGTDAKGNPTAHVDVGKVHHAEGEARHAGDGVGKRGAGHGGGDMNGDGFSATLGKDGRHPSASSSYGGTKLSSEAGRNGASAGLSDSRAGHGHEGERAGEHAGKVAEEKADEKAAAEDAKHGGHGKA